MVKGTKHTKLLTTLEYKEKCICHYINLMQAVSHGLKIKNLVKILKFSKKQLLKPYVDGNTEKRMYAKINFEKIFFVITKQFCFGEMYGKRKNKYKIRYCKQRK